MRPGKIFIMDSITPHNSNSVSTTPRLAINVKIQPRSLNYIYKIFGLTKPLKSNLKYNFEVLENDLKIAPLFQIHLILSFQCFIVCKENSIRHLTHLINSL